MQGKDLNFHYVTSEQFGIWLRNIYPCDELKELSVAFTNISEDCIDDLVGQLTTKIEKLSLQELKSVDDV